MDGRFATLAARAAAQHGVFGAEDLAEIGISRAMRDRWLRAALIERLGPRTFRFPTAPCMWTSRLAAGLIDLGPEAVVAGRSGAALLGLDGFERCQVELLVPRHLRHRRANGLIASTRRVVSASDVCRIEGIRSLRAERLILEAPLFNFTRAEVENAIDSAIRLRLTTEARIRGRVLTERSITVNGSRALVEALVDAGGESRLERAFLHLLREARIPRPQLQVRFRAGTRIVARVDAYFDDDLVVEVEGHTTHSSRRQRQADEERRTELTIAGRRTIAFTYDDVMGRPAWVAGQISQLRVPNRVTNSAVR